MHQCRSGGSGGASVELWREWGCISAEVEGVGMYQWRGGEQGCTSAVNQYTNSAHGPTYPLTLSGWGGSQKNRSLPSISS